MYNDKLFVKKILFTKDDINNLVDNFEKMFMKLNSYDNCSYSLNMIKEKYPYIKELFDIIRLE